MSMQNKIYNMSTMFILKGDVIKNYKSIPRIPYHMIYSENLSIWEWMRKQETDSVISRSLQPIYPWWEVANEITSSFKLFSISLSLPLSLPLFLPLLLPSFLFLFSPCFCLSFSFPLSVEGKKSWIHVTKIQSSENPESIVIGIETV